MCLSASSLPQLPHSYWSPSCRSRQRGSFDGRANQARRPRDRSQVYATFSHLVTDIGPRLTATPEYKRGGGLVARTAREAGGFANARLENWEFGRGWALDKFTIEMIEPRYMPLIGYPEAWSASMDGEVEAAPVFIAGKTPEELEAMKGAAEGRGPAHAAAADLVHPRRSRAADASRTTRRRRRRPRRNRRPRPRGRGGNTGRAARARPQRRARILREAGPGVLLRTSRGEHGTMFVLGRDAARTRCRRSSLAGEHYNMIVRTMRGRAYRSSCASTCGRDISTRPERLQRARRDAGDRPDSSRDEIVMLGAHLDSYHTAPGATDNADGIGDRARGDAHPRPRSAPSRDGRSASRSGAARNKDCSARVQYVAAAPRRRRQRRGARQFSVYFNIDPGTGPIYGWFLQGQEERPAR